MSKFEDTLARMKGLYTYGQDLNESKNMNTHSLEYHAIGADGKSYGIIRECNRYYIKTAPKSKEMVAESYDYIGGFCNKSNYAYDSFAKAQKQFELKMASINEAYNGNVNIATLNPYRSNIVLEEVTESMKNEIARQRQIMHNAAMIMNESSEIGADRKDDVVKYNGKNPESETGKKGYEGGKNTTANPEFKGSKTNGVKKSVAPFDNKTTKTPDQIKEECDGECCCSEKEDWGSNGMCKGKDPKSIGWDIEGQNRVDEEEEDWASKGLPSTPGVGEAKPENPFNKSVNESDEDYDSEDVEDVDTENADMDSEEGSDDDFSESDFGEEDFDDADADMTDAEGFDDADSEDTDLDSDTEDGDEDMTDTDIEGADVDMENSDEDINQQVADLKSQIEDLKSQIASLQGENDDTEDFEGDEDAPEDFDGEDGADDFEGDEDAPEDFDGEDGADDFEGDESGDVDEVKYGGVEYHGNNPEDWSAMTSLRANAPDDYDYFGDDGTDRSSLEKFMTRDDKATGSWAKDLSNTLGVDTKNPDSFKNLDNEKIKNAVEKGQSKARQSASNLGWDTSSFDRGQSLEESRKKALNKIVESVTKSILKEDELHVFGKHPGYRKKPMELPTTGDDKNQWGRDWNDDTIHNEEPFGSKIGDGSPFNMLVDAVTKDVMYQLRHGAPIDKKKVN